MMQSEIILRSEVLCDAETERVARMFDHPFDGRIETQVPDFSAPSDFGIGVIVGPSGSGKSTLLRKFGAARLHGWETDRAVVSHFPGDGEARLSGVGLNSIPSWLKPYHVLSTGERFRADMARALADGAVVDEFTSTVDRQTAASCSRAVSRFIRDRNLRQVVFATCHYDVLDWLEPDWVFDTQTGAFRAGGRWERPSIELDIFPCTTEVWPVFASHHYLSASINKSARCWLAVWGDRLVGFASALPFPNGNFKNGWRGHRTVVLPDFQGLGLGVRLSDAIGRVFVESGCRYFSKTVHPRMGAYREASSLWRATSKNGKARPDYSESRRTKEDGHKMRHISRVAYSHEFVGP
jgi:GNAT superfamily N-acetyltransferase